MKYWLRMAADLASGTKVALTAPALLLALAMTPIYAPVWGLCHWLLKNDQGHGDAPPLLIWLAWQGLGPARLGRRLKDAAKSNLKQPLTSWLMAGGAAALSVPLLTIFVQATGEGTLGMVHGSRGNTMAGLAGMLGCTLMWIAAMATVVCSEMWDDKK